MDATGSSWPERLSAPKAIALGVLLGAAFGLGLYVVGLCITAYAR